MAGEPLAIPQTALIAQALRERRGGLLAAFAEAEPVLDELFAAIADPGAAPTPVAAAALGARRAQQDSDLDGLAQAHGRLRQLVIEQLHDAGLAGDLAAARTVHAQLDRLAEASTAAFLREREAQILSMVAHDVSNPLMSICLIAGFFEDRLGPEHRRSTDTLQRAASQLRQLVRDVQDVADILGGALTIAPVVVDACEVVADVVAQLAPLARARGVKIAETLPCGPAPVLGERERLVQAVGCLLRFALKTSRADQVIAVHAELDGPELRLTVRDAGPGMSDEHRAHAFDPGVPTTSHGRKKLNAELFIARSVVEAHGGRIWIEPGPPGQGTRVTVALPLAEPPPELEA